VRVHVKVTIELSGEQSQLVPVLAELARTLSAEVIAETDESDPSWWTDERARAFVNELKLPALLALQAIAAGAPKTRVATVQHELKRHGFRMTPGSLSSIGFAVRRLRVPPPFIRDNYQAAYVMDTDVAALLQVAIKNELERRQSNGPATG